MLLLGSIHTELLRLFPISFLLLNVNSSLEMHGTYLAADTIAVADANGDVQCERALTLEIWTN